MENTLSFNLLQRVLVRVKPQRTFFGGDGGPLRFRFVLTLSSTQVPNPVVQARLQYSAYDSTVLKLLFWYSYQYHVRRAVTRTLILPGPGGPQKFVTTQHNSHTLLKNG